MERTCPYQTVAAQVSITVNLLLDGGTAAVLLYCATSIAQRHAHQLAVLVAVVFYADGGGCPLYRATVAEDQQLRRCNNRLPDGAGAGPG
jgi:hypothetical protein